VNSQNICKRYYRKRFLEIVSKQNFYREQNFFPFRLVHLIILLVDFCFIIVSANSQHLGGRVK